MGLLTDPNSGSDGGIFSRILQYGSVLSWILFMAGVGFIFVMPHPEFSHKTYFSENALLPGLVKGDYVDDGKVASFLEDLRFESKKYDNSLPYPWLEAKFRQLGLEVYTHNFTLTFPLGPTAKRSNFTGKNVYGILRAPRASSTEALVLSVPYRPPFSLEANTDVSVALLLTAADFFRMQNYWAKDIIFLITQHEQLGMQAWLEAYHQVSNGLLDHGDLEARAGSIEAAINLEITTEKISHVNVKIDGLNGRLPNLDLVNLVYRLCMREGIHQMFQGVEDHSRLDSWKGYTRSLSTLTNMALKQATGMPSGNHGLFQRFGIEAVTIEGILRRKARGGFPVSESIGKVIEGTFRSLNNLLERFHQSFFFYLLPSTSRYVSIGMYMPGFGLLASGLILSALRLWFQLQFDGAKDKNKTENTSNETKDKSDTKEDESESGLLPYVQPPEIIPVLPPLIFAHLLGLFLSYLPQPATVFGDSFDLTHEDSVALAFASTIVGFVILTSIMRPLDYSRWRIVKCVTLLELSALAFGMSLCNFGLAYLMALIYVPVALLATPRSGQRKIVSLAKTLLLLVANPLVFLYLICFVDTSANFSNKSFIELIPLTADATKRALMYSITDYSIYGNINFPVGCVLLLPCWALLWMISNAR